MAKIKIGKRFIGEGESLYFVADIAANHDGDINRAFKLIELAKGAGADAAKFQNFQADKIVSRHGFEALKSQMSHQKNWKKSVYEVYKDASLPFDWTPKLKEKCVEVGIEYFTSPYDFESIDYVDPFVNVYKIGSGDIIWTEIIKYIAEKGKPVMLSTGASTLDDVKRAMKVLSKKCDDIVLMQCNTNYTADERNFNYINLNVLKEYKKLFPEVVLGLSDHTRGFSAVLGSIPLGAVVFEKHFTDDNDREGPDHKFAMNPKDWKEMVVYANEIYKALGDGIKKVENNEKNTVVIQRRALRLIRDVAKDEKLNKKDLFPLRPCPADGILPYEIERIIGKKLRMDMKKDEYLKWEDIT